MKKRKMLLFLLALCFALMSLHGIEAVNVGVYPEVSMQVVDGIAFGGGLLFGVDFLRRWGAGLKTAFTVADGFNALEAQGFLRYNFFRGLFLQAEPGMVFFFEDGESSAAFSGGLAAGWRLFPFSRVQNLFLEPALRFGFPYIMSATMTVGFRFPAGSEKGRAQREQQEAERDAEEAEAARLAAERTEAERLAVTERDAAEAEAVRLAAERAEAERLAGLRTPEQILGELGIPFVVEGAYLRLRIASVYFMPDFASVYGLDAALIAQNNASIRRVADVIAALDGNRVIKEGHANPLAPEGSAARETQELAFIELSRNRAQWVVQQLAALGVDYDRLEVRGVGTSSAIAPLADVGNAWRNRRVEFLVIR